MEKNSKSFSLFLESLRDPYSESEIGCETWQLAALQQHLQLFLSKKGYRKVCEI